jgi:NADPH2:quinone reductase
MYQTPDMEAQGQLFNEIAELVEKAKLRSTLTNPFSPINSANFRTPHAQIKSGRFFDKIVLASWS